MICKLTEGIGLVKAIIPSRSSKYAPFRCRVKALDIAALACY